MERIVAVKKLTKLLGQKLGYRIDSKAPTPEEREAAKLELPSAIEERDGLKAARDARYQAILKGDAEYQRLHAEARTASERCQNLSSITRHRKITVGVCNGMFFCVKAEGDSWEEIIEQLQVEKQKKAA